MTVPTINTIQEAIITKLKANATLVAALGGATEIREDQWQGIDFSYPAVRVDIGTLAPVNVLDECNYWGVTFTVWTFSEQPSSMEANTLAALVVDALHKQSFTFGTLMFSKLYCSIITPAMRRDEETWLANAQFTTHIQIKS